MDFSEIIILDNPVRMWIIAAAIMLLVFTTLRIVIGILRRRLAPLAARTRTMLDDAFLCMLRHTRSFALLLLGAYCARLVLKLPQGAAKVFSVLVILGMLIQAGIWGTRMIVLFVRRYAEERAEADPSSATTMSALGFVGRLLLWTVLLLLALDNLGVDVTALIAGLGMTGIAVALALQNILGDLFASLSIVLDKPFVVGDSIGVDTFTGTVERVGLKTTRVRSVSGEQLVFSNSDLLRSRIRNFKRMEERRVELLLRVVYGTPSEKLAAIPGWIREIVEREPRARFERCHLKQCGEAALIFETIYWVTNPDYATHMDVQQEINLAIYRTFQEQGVEFAHAMQATEMGGRPPARS